MGFINEQQLLTACLKKKNLTKHTKEKDQWGIHQSFPSEMFFRHREEVKLKTFDPSKETGLNCIYCFSNSTGHSVDSHHDEGSTCIKGRWSVGDISFVKESDGEKDENS